MPKFDTRGNGLAAGGNKYALIVGAGTTTAVSTVAGVRITRFWSVTGTGVVAFYDNNAGTTTGNNVWNAATGNPTTLDIPMTAGIAVTVPLSTTIVVVYSE